MTRRRVAVIGSGIAGLSTAWTLATEAGDRAAVTLYEAGDYFGGHTHTVDLTLHGVTHGVDTGFLVFNQRTYPRLIKLFDTLQVATVPSDMSFSVQVPHRGLEWSGSNLGSVFAQRANLLRPHFWGMLADLLRFNRVCTELAGSGTEAQLRQPIAAFLLAQDFGPAFRDDYLLPMVACIWSCPTEQMLRFPMATLIRFCHNHGLLQITHRPQWFTVRGGARHYVRRMLQDLPDARLRTPVRQVRRQPPGQGQAGVLVATDADSKRYDEVVLACHSDQALALLQDATAAEKRVLQGIGYHRNRAVLHTDSAVLPRRRRAWAAWNYERAASRQKEQGAVCLHYLLNRLQPLPWQQPVLVSLNPVQEPDPKRVHAEFDYAHPVFDQRAIDAQRDLPQIQGQAHTWFCGAWTRYGFHEDGLMSGQDVALNLMARWQRRDELTNKVAA